MSAIRNTWLALAYVAVAAVGILASPMASAQATRTWVSGVGDDVNPCSRTAPCKTFAGAISKTAAGGEISVLDPGGYGAVNITKSMTIDGGTGAGWGSILNSSTTAVIINAPTNAVVTLRNLSMNGAGNGTFGIRILAAGKVFIENVQVFGNNGHGIIDQRNLGGAQLFIDRVVVRNNTGTGIVIRTPSAASTIDASINHLQLIGNGQAGLTAGTGAILTLRNSRVSGNSTGLYVEQPSGSVKMFVADTMISDNTNGLVVGAGTPSIRLSNTTITENNTGILPAAVAIRSFGNNKIEGNMAGNGPYSPAFILVGEQ